MASSADSSARISTSGARASSRTRWIAPFIALLVPTLFFLFLPPLSRSGLWDPFELNVADLARRIALNLHGAGDMALAGADNSLPHLNDLGRPQLPFTSIALGFKWWGLHEWSGRLPLALWGIAGVMATYGFVARLIDRRAGVYAAIALTTMPLYFVQARTMLGDIVTMASYAFTFGGLAVAVFDSPSRSQKRQVTRFLWLLLGIGGVFAGFYSRGGFLSVASPLLGVGIAWGIGWAARVKRADAFGDTIGALTLFCGAAVLLKSVAALETATAHSDLNMWIGAMIKPPAKYPTFDFYIGHLAPALAPWAAFVPFAFGRLFFPPPTNHAEAFRRESLARMALIIGAGVAFAIQGYLAFKVDEIAFVGVAVLAGVCGVALRDFERGAHGSIAVGVGTMVFLGLFHHDLHNVFEKDFHDPADRAYQAFAINGLTFPDSFKDQALILWTIVLVGFAVVAFFTWVERDSNRVPFEPRNYAIIVRALRDAWDGLLALGYFAMVAGASVAGLLVYVGTRTHGKWLPPLSAETREWIMKSWAITAFAPLVAIFGMYFAIDCWLWAFGRSRLPSVGSLTRGFEPFEELFGRLFKKTEPGDTSAKEEKVVAWVFLMPLMYLAVPAAVFVAALKLGKDSTSPIAAAAFAIPSGVAVFLLLGLLGDVVRGSRSAGMAIASILVGFVLCFSYYPALANQLSPKEVFESYQAVKKGNEPLALFGVGNRTTAYYIGGQPSEFHTVADAYNWLSAGDQGQRRYLAMKSDELPRLNALYRERPEHQNLPVLDARSSQILLVASDLEAGEKNQNPLGRYVLSTPPVIGHRMDVNLEDKLQVLGYDMYDAANKPVSSIAPGKKYHLRTYYKVLAPQTTEWEAFIHIDGYRRRHNGDHKMLDGKYPVALWEKDDFIADDYEFTLEPNFTPGMYNLYFGLFLGDNRLKVKTGPSDGENRINGGQIRVQ